MQTSITMQDFLAAEGGLTPQEFAEHHAVTLELRPPSEVTIKPTASVWRFLDECLYALMLTNGTGYVRGAMSRQTGVCCQSYAKATMQCFACPFRSTKMLVLRRFYVEAKEKALELSIEKA